MNLLEFSTLRLLSCALFHSCRTLKELKLLVFVLSHSLSCDTALKRFELSSAAFKLDPNLVPRESSFPERGEGDLTAGTEIRDIKRYKKALKKA